MQLTKLSAISRQLSAKSQHGMGALLILAGIGLIIAVAVVFTTPQLRNIILPPQTLPESTSSATPAVQYSEKQQLYLRNKETIKKDLNLNEEQFQLLVESASKN